MADLSKADKAVEAKAANGREVPVGFFFFPKKDDKNWGDLWHPRGPDVLPPDQAIVDDIIAQGGVEKPVIVWQQVAYGGEIYIDGEVAKKGDPLLIVGDGSQRSTAAMAAQPLMLKKGLLGAGKKDLFVPITKFVPTSPETAEREFLLLRQAHDADRLKKPHKPSVISWNLAMCKKKGASTEELLKVCPPGGLWSKSVMDAALCWGDLQPEAAKMFDDGAVIKGKLRPVPIGLLPVVLLHAVKSEQAARLIEWVESGISGMKGYTRRANAAAIEAGDEDPELLDESWEETEANSGSSSSGNAPASGSSAPSGEKKPRAAKGTSGRRPKRRVERALEILSKDPMGNILTGEFKKGKGSPELTITRWFALGAAFEIDKEIDYSGAPPELEAFIAGIGWITGVGKFKVPALVKDAYERADTQEAKDTSTLPKKGGRKKKARATIEVK